MEQFMKVCSFAIVPGFSIKSNVLKAIGMVGTILVAFA